MPHPAGTGEAKFAGNYAASMPAQRDAAEHGCDQVVWLDAVHHRNVEEMSGMNLFLVTSDNRLITPPSPAPCSPGSPATPS